MPKHYNPESDGEVEYHDEIHEALHRDARVDYTKPIIRNGKNLKANPLCSLPVFYGNSTI